MSLFDTSKAVNVTGHRPTKLNGYYKWNNQMLVKSMREEIIKLVEQGYEFFISGMALGVDLWFAEEVIDLRDSKYPHIKLVAAIPCKGQQLRWPASSQEEWAEVKANADIVHYVSEDTYTAWCLHARNEWMVDNSNHVLAYWDGTSGGTANCIRYAERIGRTITKIDVTQFRVEE